MKLSRDQLRSMYPNATDAFIDANAFDSRATPVVEPDPGHGALGTGEIKKTNPVRFLVRVTSVRKRLCDEDNLCEKYHVDCCRYASVIPQDDPTTTQIEVRQRKAGKEDERVIVEVFQLSE